MTRTSVATKITANLTGFLSIKSIHMLILSNLGSIRVKLSKILEDHQILITMNVLLPSTDPKNNAL